MAKFTRSVVVPLTDAELIDIGQRAAAKQDELAGAESDLKHESASLRRAVRDLRAQLNELLGELRTGTKTEEHPFDWQINAETKKAELIDLTTCEVVEVRDAYPHELGEQLALPLEEAPQETIDAAPEEGGPQDEEEAHASG